MKEADQVRPEMIIMIGVAGCGKSTFARRLSESGNYEYLSSDKLRGIYGKDENDQSATYIAFQQLKQKMLGAILDRKNIIIDATNLTVDIRASYVSAAKNAGYKLTAIVFEVERDELIRRCEARDKQIGKPIPIEAIDRMLKEFVLPTLEEGFDTIQRNPKILLTIDDVCNNPPGTFANRISQQSQTNKIEWTDRMKRIRAAKHGIQEEDEE
jgi:predicted kinase